VQVDADHSLSALIQDKKIGDSVTLSVWSRRQPMDKGSKDLQVTLGSTPDKKKPWLGVEYRMSSPTAFLGPWGNFPPLADTPLPDLSGSLPYAPAVPYLGMPSVPAPAI